MCAYIERLQWGILLEQFSELGMAEFKHLVLVKFKDDVAVDDILKGLEKLVSEMDCVKSFVWFVIKLLH